MEEQPEEPGKAHNTGVQPRSKASYLGVGMTDDNAQSAPQARKPYSDTALRTLHALSVTDTHTEPRANTYRQDDSVGPSAMNCV